MNIQNLELWMIAAFQFILIICTFCLIRAAKACGNALINQIESLHNAVQRLRVAVDGRFDTVNQYLAENHERIEDIKERLIFLEAGNFFYKTILESDVSNPRSQAAKEMWKRRKLKKIEKRGPSQLMGEE